MEKQHKDRLVAKGGLEEGYWANKASLWVNDLSSYPPLTMKVASEGIYYQKRGDRWRMTINGNLGEGEIIKVGALEFKYRIIKHTEYSSKGNRSYRIKRIDRKDITAIDIANAKPGTKINVISRQSPTEYLRMIDEL